MGGDGGCLITRADCVKTKGYGFTKSSGGRYTNSLGEMANYVQMVSEDQGLGPHERRKQRMSSCWLSQQPLCDPVVACRLGNLYNKEAIINALLNKCVPKEIAHIRALKDVKQCQLTWVDAEDKKGCRHMVCPVSRNELDAGSSRAVLIWTSGAVISEKSLKELKMKECPLTSKAFDPDKDVIPLAPDLEELDKLRERLPSKKRKAPEGSVEASMVSESASSSSKISPETANDDTGSQAPADKDKPDKEKIKKSAKSEVFQSLFTADRPGMAGPRDAFGTPMYNRGAHMQK